MKLAAAIAYVDLKIAELEKQLYLFDTVVFPRADQDKRILRQMREQRLKMRALYDKIVVLDERKKRGEMIPKEEEVTTEEYADCLPPAFR